MTTKTLLSLATVALLAATSQATTVETTNSWFSVNAATVDLSAATWGTVVPTREEAATVIDVDTSADAPAKYTPSETKPSATRYRVTGSMTVTLNAAVPGNTVFGETLPKAALVAVAGTPNKWYAWHLTAANAGTWVEMTGVAAPVDNTTYPITIEFTSTTVSYTVNGTTLGTAESLGETKVLSTVGGLNISSIGLAGYGSFGDFGAVGYEEFEVVVPAANVEDVKSAMGIAEITAETLNTEGANGLTVWESIVLGLDSPAAVPYTAPVQVPDEGGKTYLGFKIGNANAADYGVSGSTAKFTVYECYANGNPVENGDESDETAAGGTAKIEANSSGVKYYKIKIKFE